MNRIIFCSAKFFHSLFPVDSGKKYCETTLSIGWVASPNQQCCQRNNSLLGLNEDKDLFMTLICLLILFIFNVFIVERFYFNLQLD